MKRVQSKTDTIIKNIKIFKRVTSFLFKCDYKYMLFNIFITIFFSLLPVISISIMRNLINSLYSSDIDIKNTMTLVIIYVGIDIVSTILQRIDSFYGEFFNLKLTEKLKLTVLNKTKDLSLKDFENSEIYNLIQRAEQTSDSSIFIYFTTFMTIIQKIITLSSISVILVLWKWWIVFIIALSPILMSIKMLQLNEEQFLIRRNRTDKDRLIWYISYILTKDISFKEVKLNNLYVYFIDKFKETYKFIVDTERPMIKKRFLYSLLFRILDHISLGLIFIMIIIETISKLMIVGDTIAYINSSAKVKDSISELLNNITTMYKDSLYINQLFEFIDLEITDCPQEDYLIENINSIELKNLSYKYNNGIYVLKNINLKIKKNDVVAIVGKNGSGKTTLIRLLCGFYSDYEGEILINGIELKKINKTCLRSLTSSLFQDFCRYEMNLRENIGLGDTNKIHNDNLIYESLNKAGFTRKLNDGLSTQLGYWFDFGEQLSGGEWQKVAISRVLLKESDLMILDEPTSALDPISESNLFNNIKPLMLNKISVIVTHKINEIKNVSNKVIVLDSGYLVAEGDHELLFKESDKYREIYMDHMNKVEYSV